MKSTRAVLQKILEEAATLGLRYNAPLRVAHTYRICVSARTVAVWGISPPTRAKCTGNEATICTVLKMELVLGLQRVWGIFKEKC